MIRVLLSGTIRLSVSVRVFVPFVRLRYIAFPVADPISAPLPSFSSFSDMIMMIFYAKKRQDRQTISQKTKKAVWNFFFEKYFKSRRKHQKTGRFFSKNNVSRLKTGKRMLCFRITDAGLCPDGTLIIES